MVHSILLVGGEPDLFLLLHDVLEGAGYSVCSAATGHDALELVADGYRPSLVVLDVALSDVGCLLLAEEVRELPGLHALPAVVVTSFPDAPTAIGLTRFLGKTFSLESLFVTLKGHGLVARQRADVSATSSSTCR
jgi:CheY-like chemotaxis protein